MAIVDGTSAAETLKGTPDDDVISGLDGHDILVGGGGNDQLVGGAGNDILKGGGGDDSLLGGDGDDRLVGKVGFEFMDGGEGDDTYRLMPSVSGAAFQFSDSGAAGTDTIDAARILSLTLSDVFDTGSGIEVIAGNAVTRLVLYGSDAGVAWDFSQFTLLDVKEIGGGAGDDAITGADGDDRVKGRAGADMLAGGDGDDVLAGGAGADMLDGGAGDDVLKGGGGRDVLDGGAGNDTLKGGNGNDTLVHDAGDGTRVDGGAGHDTLAFQGAGESLDLAQAAGVTHFGLEAVDLTGSGDNVLLLTRASLLALSNTSDTLQVLGDAGDVIVTKSGEWLDGGTEVIDGITFDVFTNGVATLQVQQGVTLGVNTGGNDAPVILESEAAAVTAGATVTTGNVLDNGRDPDKDALVLDDFDATSAGGGSVTDNGDGTFDYDPGDAFDELTDGQTATDTFTYTLSDGQGGTVTGTVTVTITGVNDAPVITTSAALAVAENSTAVVTLAAADPDTGAELTWSISGGADAGLFAIDAETGELSFLSAPVFGSDADAGGNDIYDVTVQVSDGALTDTLALAVTVTDAPEVSGVGGTVAYTIGTAPVVLDDSAMVSDGDSTHLAGATISVINFQPGDVLHFTDIGAITHTYDANTGVLTLSGTDTKANYEAALGSVEFSTTSLVQADRTVEFTVNDGTNDSAPVSVTVDIAPSVDLSVLDGTSGFRIDAVVGSDFQGGPAVAGIGDINGDGYDDVIVGARYADDGGNDAGAAYVVFGSAAAAGSALALSSLDGNNGFRIDGDADNDQAGYRVAGGGDVNGDGIDDLVISANNSGDVYVVFGDAAGFGSSLSLATLDGTTGVRLVAESDTNGRAEVSIAGDINGDGFADLVLGYYQSNLPFSVGGGAYVVFGASGFSATLELSSLNGSNGFQVISEGTDGKLGKGASGAGDVNGDGFDDVIVGAYNVGAGAAWVIHGKASGWGSELALTGISGTSGFQLNGGAAGDHAGVSVADAGDVNGDGFADLLVGADFADTGASNAGNAYLVYGNGGNLSDLSLSTLNGSNGFVIEGETVNARAGTTVDGAGDLDGDGYDDLLVGSSGGPTYVIFGSAAGPGATLDLSALDGTDGFELNAGGAVSAAGDVNGDGFADLIVGHGSSAFVIFGRDLRDQAHFTGGAGNDDLTGTGADEIIHGGAGDDTLDGSAGSDVLEGGAGDDVLHGDADDLSLDGGPGHDTLIIEGGGVTLFLTVPEPALTGIEVIDLTGSGDNTLDLDLGGVADLVGPGGTLRVLGNTGDAVDRDDGWSFTGLLVEDGGTYRVFEQGSLTLEVALDVDLAQGVELALSSLSGATGTPITSNNGVQFGAAVSTAGDMNGDGFADLLIGAPGTDVLATDAGAGYVFYGSAAGPGPENGLLNLMANDKVGTSVAGAGDVNGDGLADLIVGAPFADPNGSNSGASFVVFGNATLIGTLNLPLLNGSTGFKISGVAGGNQSGYSVSTAGDVNGDGYADLLVGAPSSSALYGASYVVFGKASGFASNLNLSTLDGTNGFAISTVEPNGYAGRSVSSAGDINGDGFDDLLIGAPKVDGGDYDNGAAYVVFGAASGFDSGLALSSLDGSNGFRMVGEGTSHQLGRTVSSAGDVNGDGFDDIVIGRPGGGGGAYVVFGAASGFTADLDLSTLDGSNGFLIEGGESTAGFYVSDAGDINGDGLGDLIVGGSGANVSYVIFGAATGFASSLDLGALDGTDGFRIRGDAGSSAVVSAAGDVNGDGYDDLLVGSKDDGSAGTAYLVYGADFRDEIDFTGTDGVDTLTGTGAADLMVAGRGADTVNAGGGADGVNGGAGADALNGEAGADRLEGGTGADTLDGGADNDRLFGDEGADTLDGGLGNDDLTGGMGNDTFLFNDTLGATNVDRILDFGGAGAAGLDVIHLDNAMFTSLGAGSLSGAAFESGTDNVASAAATRIIYNTDTGALYYDADGSGGGSAAVQFALLVGNPDGISVEDFLIV